MKIAVFAGTYEGRILCESLGVAGIEAVAFVATPYGAELLDGQEGITVYCGRLDQAEMTGKIKEYGFNLVIDATHPYAWEVTQNIQAACACLQIRYIRLLRRETRYEGVTEVFSAQAAVDILKNTAGNILLTTGSKDLSVFCQLPGYQERLFARVLPSAEVLARCEELGLPGRRIIAAQGPFSEKFNIALLKEFDCKWLVTKNTGQAGGADDKLSAARKAGVEVMLISRPLRENGYSIEEVMRLVDELAEGSGTV